MRWDAICGALEIKISLENPQLPQWKGAAPYLQLFTPHVKKGTLRHSI